MEVTMSRAKRFCPKCGSQLLPLVKGGETLKWYCEYPLSCGYGLEDFLKIKSRIDK